MKHGDVPTNRYEAALVECAEVLLLIVDNPWSLDDVIWRRAKNAVAQLKPKEAQ